MHDTISAEKISMLKDFGNVVPEGYNYYKKKFSPGKPVHIQNALLKWYNLYPVNNAITDEQVREAKTFLKSEAESGILNLKGELGFAILHRAGDYLLLLVSTWRQTNEIWETSFWKKLSEPDSYVPFKFKDDHKATYCVWELGAVWHERNAWVRFIESNRDEKAKLNYINDMFEGEV